MFLVWREKKTVGEIIANYAAIIRWDLYQMTSDDTDGTELK